MSTKNIVCFCTELERFYFSPIMLLGNNYSTTNYQNVYVFIGHNDAGYDNANNVTTITVDSMRQTLNDIIFMKKINLNDISVVIERIDWKTNTFYDRYDSDTTLSDFDDNGKLRKKFYIRNKFDQVFKCLWNNINSSNTFNINSIQSTSNYTTILHNGGTFSVGGLVTLQNVNPKEYNGTYKVINSSLGSVVVDFNSVDPRAVSTSVPYINGGTIKNTILSTQEPMLDFGTFDSENIVETSDGYKWKYIYTLEKSSKLKFFDNDWMPVLVTTEFPNPKISPYGFGSIDTIDIVNPGDGYQDGTGTVFVNIDGDGEGASADCLVVGGKIQNITIRNPGKNYTRATITLIPLNGSGANSEIHYTISPIGGHGINPIRDFFARNIMVVGTINENENGQLPGDLQFNQVGIMYNPYVETDTKNHATNSSISRLIVLTVTSGDTKYIPGELVTQTDSAGNVTYVGKVISFDNTNNFLRVINREGTLLSNIEISGKTSGAVRIITTSANTIAQQVIYTPYSGNMFYLENREISEKSEKGIELVKILLNYRQ